MSEKLEAIQIDFAVKKVETVGELVRETWLIFWRNFWTIFNYSTVVMLLPLLILNYFEPWLWFNNFNTALKFVFEADVIGIFGSLSVPAVLYAVVYRMRVGSAPRMGQSFRWAFSRWTKVFGARFMVGILFLGGTLAFLVPAFIVAVRYCFVTPVAALGLEGEVDALKRSAYLTKGRGWTLFGAGLTLNLISLAFGFVASLMVMITWGIAVWKFAFIPKITMMESKWALEAVAGTVSDVFATLLSILCLVGYLSWRGKTVSLGRQLSGDKIGKTKGVANTEPKTAVPMRTRASRAKPLGQKRKVIKGSPNKPKKKAGPLEKSTRRQKRSAGGSKKRQDP